MALDYGQLFGDLGSLIARIDSYSTLGGTTLAADLSTLTTQFGTRWLPPEGVASVYEGLRDQVTAWRRQLAGYADRRLSDQALVLSQLGLQPGASLDDALAALIKRMALDGKAVKACACAATTPAADAGSQGTGRAWVTTVLDGYSAPLAGGRAEARLDGMASELCVTSEMMTLECVADGVTDGLTEGGESFAWSGGPDYGELDVRAEGSGQGPTLSCANEGGNVLSGGDLELWASGVPSGWTLEAGAVTQDQGVYYRGTSSLAVAGPQSLARVSQVLAPGLVYGRRRYFLGLSVLASAAAAGATVRAYLCSSSGTPVRGALEVDGADLPLAWAQYGRWLNFPSPLPATWKVVLEVQGLPAGVTAWLDAAVLTPAAYHGGVGLALTAGASAWQRGDRLTWGVSNDDAGRFQRFFRRHYRTQLPSVASGTRQPGGLLSLLQLLSWTIAESVADSQVI